MAIKVELDYKWEQSIYLKNDIEQVEYLLHGVLVENKKIFLKLFRPDGEFIFVPIAYTLTEMDVLKKLDADKKDDEET